ncbi:MAG: T9SS type A sorting domain-containing protein, partial [Fibrobacter sp.]|nr:T9SS type A sorting domain-containing protein [Fibrobacter sp.]
AEASNAYVNVGGAAGSSWLDYQYGRPANASKWSETTVDLENEGQNGSTALTFNSDASGIYIAKIVATGCTSTPIHQVRKFQSNDSHMMAQIFDLNGNLIWSGVKGQALNANGTIRLDIQSGTYLLKTKAGVVKAIKK